MALARSWDGPTAGEGGTTTHRWADGSERSLLMALLLQLES